MNAKFSDDDPRSSHPNPNDFDVYLAWACDSLQMPKPLLISKIIQNDYVSVIGQSKQSTKDKGKLSKVDIAPLIKEDSFALPKAMLGDLQPGIQILAYYDATDHLVKLLFDNNKSLPQTLFKIIGLIIHFQQFMQAMTINRGLNKECVYEISKFLPLSKITELCLDNSFIEQANYHLLLEKDNSLRSLSLARCSINDAVIEQMASALTYPNPGSKSLRILNLSSNKISDLGAKFLGESLRSNRVLCYLNLSDNMLTDTGAGHLLNPLLKFTLSFAELIASRSRLMTYLKLKNEMIIRMVQELRAIDFEKRAGKRKSIGVRPGSTPKKKGLEKESSLKSLPEGRGSMLKFENIFMDKATNMAESAMGVFSDPFDKGNTFCDDGIVYSQGNNSVAYINFAYNNLSYVTVRKLLKVLMYQKEMGRKPRGLINVSIDGNFLPVTCKELLQVDNLLEMGLMIHSRRYSLTSKKRVQPKVASAGR